MRNITPPRTVSFEDALRNLASRLTGTPVTSLPSTQEGIVQYMAENLPAPASVDVDALAEAITAEVLARLSAPADAGDNQDTPESQQASADTQEAAEGALDIIDGHITVDCLEKMTNADLVKLAEALGADVSKCKKKADFVAILATVEVQAETKTTE